MLTHLAPYAAVAYDHPGWTGPGWWLVFPVLFWTLVLTTVGYLIYRRSPRQSARAAAERTLAERYARGEIDVAELRQRRRDLRGGR
jgi:putative membrane protein